MIYQVFKRLFIVTIQQTLAYQRAERKDPSLAIDTVDRAVRVMLDNERNEDGYKYEESYIYNLNADDIIPDWDGNAYGLNVQS